MVRPIDAQQSILQSHPMEKVQNVQQRHADMQQRYFDLQLTEERRLQKEKVKDLEQKEPAGIKDEHNHDGQKREMKEREKRDGEALPPDELQDDEPVPGSHIDIKA